MEEQKLSAEEIAKLLGRPEGLEGMKVAEKMNESNWYLYSRTYDFLDARPNEHILEIGPANGFFIRELIEKIPGLRYTGIDHSDDMILEALDRNDDLVELNKVSLCCGISNLMPYPDSTFDRAFCINTIYFWENPENDLKEIRRVLKHSGRLVISLRTKETNRMFPFAQHGFRLYDEAELTKLLQTCGFGKISLQKIYEPVIMVQGEPVNMESYIAVAEKLD